MPFLWTDVMVKGSLSYCFFSFEEDTIFMQQYFIAGLIDPVYMHPVFLVHVFVCLFLSVCPYFRPVSKERDIEQHILSKSCFTWWYFKNCVIGRANRPCCIGEKFSDVNLIDCVSHIYVSCVEHCHDCLMHLIKYCIHWWVLDTGWCMLQTIWFTDGLEVKLKFTSIVGDNVLTMWVIAKPGLID